MIGETDSEDDTKRAKLALDSQANILVRTFLTLRLNRDFLYGITDILRLRTTAATGYIRVQTETAGLLKILVGNNSLANDWLDTLEDEAGSRFYRAWHGEIKKAIRDLGLEWHYQRASGMALHSRIGGIASGLIIGLKDRKPGEIKLNFQEVKDIRYLLISFGLYLRFHQKILAQVRIMYPEISQEQLKTLKFEELFFLENNLWQNVMAMGRSLKII